MKKGKGAFIAIVALVVAAIGVIIALAAYFKNRSSYLYDDEDFLFDDPDELAYYNTENNTFGEPSGQEATNVYVIDEDLAGDDN